MFKVPFKQVDVFTAEPFKGNPVAVVLEGDHLTDEEMQRIAAWTNLSETTFVLKRTTKNATHRVRIFTPRAELPFAGHPTLGTAHALLEAGLVPADARALLQECARGLVPIEVVDDAQGRRLFLELPRARARMCDPAVLDELDAVLGAKARRDTRARIIDVGATWIVCCFNDGQTVRKMTPNMARLAALAERGEALGVTVFAPEAGEGSQMVVRSFAPGQGIPEDPVCGSGNGCVAVFLMQSTDLFERIGATYTASQGREVGRDGKIEVRITDDGRVLLGGACVTCIDGQLIP
jgi:PhzF family phenazine biosynthesis protein